MKTGIIEKIKDNITCPDYMAREHGYKLVGGRCKSFRPDAQNVSSLLVNERDWYDFGSGKGGDIIDLAAQDKFSGDKGQAIRYLAEKWGIEIPVQQIEVVFRSYVALLDAAADFYHDSLQQRQINYLHGRGLTDETINALKLGWSENPCDYLKKKGFTQEQIAESGILSFTNRIMIPYLRNGRTVYFAGRASVWDDALSANADAKYMKLSRTELSEHPVWGMDSLKRPETVIIAEGIFDAISCWQEGYPVVTAVTGAFSAEQKKDLYPALKGRSVIVCMDYDPETHAGQKFTEKLADELFEFGIDVSVVFLTGNERKIDLSELYAADPEKATLEKLFDTAVKWTAEKIRRISAIESDTEKRSALAGFLRTCSIKMDWPTVAQLVDDAEKTGAFAKTWLRELAKNLNKAPKELTVVQDFIKNYDCVFHDSLGWYEYQKSVWKRVSEYEIKQKIAELLGQYRTAKLVDSVFRLLKSELIRKDLFDQTKALINFPNGMFNLETGKLQPHSREYFSSIQMAYSYSETAECPEWNKFIADVTDGDDTRAELLQQMFGYCLTRDARYQKSFCLIGEGANGKSVLLTLLEAMVGSENTSHVEIAFLSSDFQRIKLLSSMVNICNDMKTDVSGTESFFKAIVAGDPITGCYKGENFVDFRPFCKMIFSSNNMVTAKEVDYSYQRRFCFINFPIKFVDVPKAENERQKDPAITIRLLKELPGIFNWAYDGLKALWYSGVFPETSEHQRLCKEMALLANPLISFVEDVVGNGGEHWATELTKKEVYKEYAKWCIETNTKPMSARGFWPRLLHIFPYRERFSHGTRYITFTEPRKYCGDSCGD